MAYSTSVSVMSKSAPLLLSRKMATLNPVSSASHPRRASSTDMASIAMVTLPFSKGYETVYMLGL